jgi:hypothetical protein
MLKSLAYSSLILLISSSCGYRYARSYKNESAETISIPFVTGDDSGTLTSYLVEEINKETGLQYQQAAGKYILNVRIVDRKFENIGFRFDHQKQDRRQRNKLIPNESRIKILAEVTVIDSTSNSPILGPAHIIAYADFDHQNRSINHSINRVSQGQLTDIDTASSSVNTPLYRNLAHEIADYLTNHMDAL